MWWKIALLGLALRLTAIYYFSRSDNYYEGLFKNIVDVDYKVYLDASLYDSPYQRHTYRYSPLLAWMVAPSYDTHQLFGKALIALFDALSIVFIYKIFEGRGNQDAQANSKAAKIVSFFYCLNPVLIYLTVRGSCEGITMALACAFWYFYIGGDCNGNMSPVERIDKSVA
jgi:GPI mannosyltransferase 1 subunit M